MQELYLKSAKKRWSVVLPQNGAAVVIQVEQGRLEGERKWTVTGDTSYISFRGIPYAAPPIGKWSFNQNGAAVVVQVEQGLLQGEKKWTVTGDTSYNCFKGIPYAAPPTGKLRFKAPQPALPWTGIRNATEYGNVCPQYNLLSYIFTPGNEDCLFLNVYTPNLTPDSALPVIVYIHGGAYLFGSSNDYGPDFFMDEQKLVIVTINYRLDTLGFLSLDSKEVPGNAGMKDQVAALRWVQRNIKNFGGDPNQVTIFGQSAGASSCTLHAMSPMSKGLFHRIIALSGAPISEYSVAFESKRRALLLGKNLGFETTNTTALFEFLQTIPEKQLIYTDTSVIAAEKYISEMAKVYFVPVKEKDFGQERFLIESPEESLKHRQTNDVDMLIGFTTNEAMVGISMIENELENYKRYPEVLCPRNLLYQISPAVLLKIVDSIKKYYFGSEPISKDTIPQLVNYFTSIFNHDIIRYANNLSKQKENKNLYMYQFSAISKRNLFTELGAKYIITGVAHADELEYMFQSGRSTPVDKNDTSYKMIKQTCALLTNFAIYGNPTPDSSLGVEWPKYNTKSKKYLDIGEKLTVGEKPLAPMIEFWKSIYHLGGVLF